MTLDEALADLVKQVDLSVEPALTKTQAKDALTSTMRYKSREASTAVEFGARIAIGGRLYRCVWDGATASETPAALGRTRLAAVVSDGSAQWEDIGPRPSRQYDLVEAKRYLCTLRIERSAELMDSADKDTKMNYSQIHEHWVAERGRLGRVCAV